VRGSLCANGRRVGIDERHFRGIMGRY